jgi:hypothetical protein
MFEAMLRYTVRARDSGRLQQCLAIIGQLFHLPEVSSGVSIVEGLAGVEGSAELGARGGQLPGTS